MKDIIVRALLAQVFAPDIAAVEEKRALLLLSIFGLMTPHLSDET